MNKGRGTIALVAFLFAYSLTNAQSRFSGWFMLMNTNKINKNLSTHFDFQLRSDDQWKNMETVIIRPGLNFHFKNQMVGTIGYAYIEGWRNIDEVRGSLAEHRIWQQLVIPQTINRLKLNHRFRLEERFVPHAVKVNDKIEKAETRYSTRLRYFFRTIIPLPHQQKFEKGFFVAIQNETMFNVTNASNVNNKFFDQNRLYLAVGWRLREELDLETGYLYQYVEGRGSSHVSNHVLQFAVYLRL